jgi:hypothetical protein
MVIAIETLAFHFLLMRWHPAAAWGLTLLNIASIVWLIRDDRALGSSVMEVGDEMVTLQAGRRFTVRVPRAMVAEARAVSWKEALPRRAPGYLKGSGFTAPNVLVCFRAPVSVPVFGASRPVERIGLRLDDAAGFVAALQP